MTMTNDHSHVDTNSGPVRRVVRALALNEDLNFLLTNRIPRIAATRFFGWFSRIEQPLVRDVSIAVWKLFTDLDLSDARDTRFRSLHDCFTRALVDGARPFDPDPEVLASPCDAIVGAWGAACAHGRGCNKTPPMF